MKKVILLRHAKSSWGDPAIGDHDRPLNKRGRAAVPVIAAWLNERAHLPDIVLCSSATRTRQTVQIMCDAIPDLPDPPPDPLSDPVIEHKLYHASPGTMFDLLRELPGECSTVMLVAHQPGIGSLVRQLSDGREERHCKRAYSHFPTAAAAVLEFDVEGWPDIDYAGARFIDFAAPRELTGD